MRTEHMTINELFTRVTEQMRAVSLRIERRDKSLRGFWSRLGVGPNRAVVYYENQLDLMRSNALGFYIAGVLVGRGDLEPTVPNILNDPETLNEGLVSSLERSLPEGGIIQFPHRRQRS